MSCFAEGSCSSVFSYTVLNRHMCQLIRLPFISSLKQDVCITVDSDLLLSFFCNVCQYETRLSIGWL
jgi:hypothetical protein